MREDMPRKRFREAARDQRVCAVTGNNGPWDAHHVLERRWLKVNAPEFEWDPRNALRLSKRVHERHTNAVERVPSVCLMPENIEFIAEILGEERAMDYIRWHYDTSGDPRFDPKWPAQLGAPR